MPGCGSHQELADAGQAGGSPTCRDPQGGAPSGGACHTSWYATQVVSVSYGPGQSFGRDAMPGVALGPPKGGGDCQGSTDVVSLGNGGVIVLGFDRAIEDGPGADFVVFENPFGIGGNPDNAYAELGTVAVSEDATNWKSYPSTATAAPYGACAGWRPVRLSSSDATAPVDPVAAGGDAFDLADVGLTRARYVRVTDRADIPLTVFDLDAVGLVHGDGCH